MLLRIPAALALFLSSSLVAQGIADLSSAKPISGAWVYNATPDGSEARFNDASTSPQLIVHCTRAIRRVTISKLAATASPVLNIWTSSERRSLAASFNASTARASADVDGTDELLDALAMSRGRVGVSVGSEPPLVAPPWPELARVVEDCRG